MKKNFLIFFMLSTIVLADPQRDFFEIKKQIEAGSGDRNVRVRFAQLALATGNYKDAQEALVWIRKNNVPNWSEWATAQTKYLPMLGQKAPDFQGKDFDGWTIKQADYQGRVLLIHFWTAADGANQQTLPQLVEIFRKYKSSPFFSLLSVSLDKDKETVKRMVSAQKLNWPQIFEGEGWNSPTAKSFQVQGTPTFVLVDGDGILRYVGQPGQILEDAVEVALNQADEKVKASSAAVKVTPRSKDNKVVCVQPLDVFSPANLSKVQTRLYPGAVLTLGQSNAVPGMVSVIYDDPATLRTVDGLIPRSAIGEGENKK